MSQTVIESLKSSKQKLYEKYILDSEGKLKLYSPIVQEVLLKVLEAAQLQEKVKEYDREVEAMKEARNAR